MEAAPKDSKILEFTTVRDDKLHKGIGSNLAELGHKGVSTQPENQKPIPMDGLKDTVQYIGDSWEEATTGEGLAIGNRVVDRNRNPINMTWERLKKIARQKAA